MATKLKPTNHDSWLLHFHLGRGGTPLTLYLMDDGTYEIWHGNLKYLRLSRETASAMFGNIMIANSQKGIRL